MKKEKVFTLINPNFLKGVAHRGLHNDEYPENSLNAFKNAIDNDFAFEFDVHLTKDKEVVISHDSSLKRMCNKEGIIEELTLEEIKNNYKLPDGSSLPTLKEVLSINDEKVPMVIELKGYKKNYKEIAKRVIEELKVIKDKRNVIVISFYPQCLLPFKKENYIRCLLLLYKRRWLKILSPLFEGFDVEHTFFNNKNYDHMNKKKFIMTWTIDDKEKLVLVKDKVDTITFEKLDINELKS